MLTYNAFKISKGKYLTTKRLLMEVIEERVKSGDKHV